MKKDCITTDTDGTQNENVKQFLFYQNSTSYNLDDFHENITLK